MVIFKFNCNDASEAFYLWWKKEGQSHYKEACKHNDLSITIQNIDCASDVEEFKDANHAVVIREIDVDYLKSVVNAK